MVGSGQNSFKVGGAAKPKWTCFCCGCYCCSLGPTDLLRAINDRLGLTAVTDSLLLVRFILQRLLLLLVVLFVPEASDLFVPTVAEPFGPCASRAQPATGVSPATT